MFEQILIPAVGLFRGCEARKLPHGEKLAAIASRVDPSSKRSFPGMSELLAVIPVSGQVSLGIKATDGDARDGSKTSVAILVQVDACWGTNRPLGSFLQCRAQRVFCPGLFTGRGLPSLKNIADRAFRDAWFFVRHAHPCLR